MSPSYQHGYVCLNLGSLLRECKQYSVFSELTLLIEKEYVPDLCVYPYRKVDFTADDTIRMTEMPLAIMEVLSPRQAILDIQEKFPVYFSVGVKSCWLVIPQTQTVTVYTAPGQGQLFKTGNVIDSALNIELSLEEIFI